RRPRSDGRGACRDRIEGLVEPRCVQECRGRGPPLCYNAHAHLRGGPPGVHVRWLELSAFRNYASLSFAPDPGLNVLVGPNGQGKTSLLEALHLLLTGRSFRTTRMAECVAWDAPEARVAGEVAEAEQRREIRLAVRAGGAVETIGGPCPWARVVTFGAPDLALITGPPAGRRGYLDGATPQLAPAHAGGCRRYPLVLHQRSGLLGQLARRPDAERLLAPW